MADGTFCISWIAGHANNWNVEGFTQHSMINVIPLSFSPIRFNPYKRNWHVESFWYQKATSFYNFENTIESQLVKHLDNLTSEVLEIKTT